jgi:hypothetical protein
MLTSSLHENTIVPANRIDVRVKKCWASALCDRAYAYSAKQYALWRRASLLNGNLFCVFIYCLQDLTYSCNQWKTVMYVQYKQSDNFPCYCCCCYYYYYYHHHTTTSITTTSSSSCMLYLYEDSWWIQQTPYLCPYVCRCMWFLKNQTGFRSLASVIHSTSCW